MAESLEQVTYETDRECRVETGRWWAPYLAHHLGNPAAIDVDHHVPLRNAHLSGGWRWDAAKKEEFTNDLDDPTHLVAISARHNRSKGARGPEDCRPPDEGHWCQYAGVWTEIKVEWNLTMTQPEAEAVAEMLGTCEDSVKVTTETGENVPVPTQEPHQGPVYGSCEEAAETGEERVLGNRGGGEGFQKEIVPSARDGDRDGIVCEQ